MKWKIIKKKEANVLGIRTLKAGPDRYLMIDTNLIPKGLSLPEFIENIQRRGIVTVDKKSKGRV